MKKKVFKIIGSPISHSLSPSLHTYWFNKYTKVKIWPIAFYNLNRNKILD